ncbi:BTB/POZ protein [Gigaspora margarita]|uniref:BTB/POZ protein n=1 Tax=Gigaspora margarita TaxID=4874 RepID=A0A8H4A5M1_GIGMA|nr:BTB/POZ protein [Gigaspora margarita]
MSTDSSNSLIELSNDFNQLLTSSSNYDVIIKAGDENDVKEFRVHALILITRSQYFRTALSDNWARKEGNVTILEKPNVSPKIFHLLLRYLYTGVIDFDSLDGPLILQILIAADELYLDSLLKRVDDYLIYKHADFLRKDPGQILQIIFKYEPCSKFRDLCLKTICESPEILFSSPDFLSLDKTIFLLLLKRGDLIMDDIEIWNYMLKWGAAQISNNFKIEDISKWSSQDISLLKDLLLDLIPLIKWLEISSTAFWRNVIPYKKIFPKELLWAIIGYHLDPNDVSITKSLPPRCLQSLPLFDSLIIGQKHFSVIASWLEKQDSNYFEKRKLSYSFSLLLRASQDGSSSDKFHNLCDNKGPILIISKIRQNGQIIGGYCPIDLKPGLNVRHNESWLASQDSFVFCFNINSNFNYIARVSDNQKAIYYNPNTCIGFGLQDMLLSNNQIRSLSDSSYGNIKHVLPRGTHNLENYEVFQVIKK